MFGRFIGPETIIATNQKFKLAKEIKKGDYILNNNQVLCVVKCFGSTIIDINDEIAISHSYPIMKNHFKWQYPSDFSTKLIGVDCQYNFILSGSGIMKIGKKTQFLIPTIGHRLHDNSYNHDYISSNKIIYDLENLEGYKDGEVCISNIRINKFGKIYKFE